MNPYDAPKTDAPVVDPVPTWQIAVRLLLMVLQVASSAMLLVEMPHGNPFLIGFNLGAALAWAAWLDRRGPALLVSLSLAAALLVVAAMG